LTAIGCAALLPLMPAPSPLASAVALADAGHAFAHEKKWTEAIAAFERALTLNPNMGIACGALAFCYEKRERFTDAIEAYSKATELLPDSLALAFNLANVLRTEGRLADAETSYRRALSLDPSHVLSLGNLGLTLHSLGRPDEAIACYARALEIRPDYAEAINNLGSAYVAKNQIGTALEAYRAALLLDPSNRRIAFNEGVAHLLAGDLEAGFRGYEHRVMPPWQQAFSGKKWDGRESLEGRSILVAYEQGFGDTIHFVRYAERVAEMGAEVHLMVQPGMKRLLSSVRGVASVVAAGEPLPPHDTHCSMMSLPFLLGTTLETVPARIPYLAAPASLSAAWAQRLEGPRPLVGLAWSGNPTHHLDRWRSVPQARLTDALGGVASRLVGLQKEIRLSDARTVSSRQSVAYFGGEIQDFADTAALISQVDLVVSVDTSVAHLAGALGKPVWILLPYAPDFRWMLGRTDSPWYPTARLFRQQKPQDWEPVLDSVRQSLRDWAAAARPQQDC